MFFVMNLMINVLMGNFVFFEVFIFCDVFFRGFGVLVIIIVVMMVVMY